MLPSSEVKHHFKKIIIAQDAIIIFFRADMQEGFPCKCLDSDCLSVWNTPSSQNFAGYSPTVTKEIALVLSLLTIINGMDIDGYPSIPIRLVSLSQEVINLLCEFRVFLHQVNIILHIIPAPVQIIIGCGRRDACCR